MTITFEQLTEAAESEPIQTLNIDMFSQDDIVKLALQRSEILLDQPRPGRLVRAWTDGNEEPIRAVAARMGDTLIRRAAAVIWLEYQQLASVFSAQPPTRVADIGCGYALFDLFIWLEHRPSLVLIDLEDTAERHFGFNATGAAYSNLAVARRFLEGNGVPSEDIVCRNAANDPLDQDAPVDLAVSFISCGFHYPVATYLDYFRDQVTPTGTVILDLRARRAQQGIDALRALGEVEELMKSSAGSGIRMRLRKRQGVAA